jgi:REP element-mobilizing transposase RayT
MANSVFEVTCRTIQSRLLLKPSLELNDIILGILGRALHLFPGIKLHAFVFLSNHYHLLLTTVSLDQLANFMCYINSNIAREAGRLYDWKEKFWGRRYYSTLVQDDNSMIDRLTYILSHGVKENLVSKSSDWPGPHCVHALTSNTNLSGHWFDRSGFYNSQRNASKAKHKQPELKPAYFKTEYQVVLSPLPCWADLSLEQQNKRVQEIVDNIEKEAKKQIDITGIKPMGPKGVLNQSPTLKPFKTKRSRAPICHASSKQARSAYRDLYRQFVTAFRQASIKLRTGITNVKFPDHCFPPSLAYNFPQA